jgi:hypothetical protein
MKIDRVDITLRNVDIQRLSELQHQFIMAAHVSKDETGLVFTNDKGPVVSAHLNPVTKLGFCVRKEWNARAMQTTVHDDFTVRSVGNLDQDIAAIALVLAKQALTNEDIMHAVQSANANQVGGFELIHVIDGKSVPYARVNTETAPGANGQS